MSLQKKQLINLALISFVCVNTAVVIASYEVVKCPDLEGNLINYPSGTECFDNSDKELDGEGGDNNKDDN